MLGAGSVFIAPGGGGLGGYLDGLRRLRALGLRAAATRATGPAVEDPDAKLDEYIAHRLERERRIVAALDAGVRGEDALVDAAWDGVPDGLRGCRRRGRFRPTWRSCAPRAGCREGAGAGGRGDRAHGRKSQRARVASHAGVGSGGSVTHLTGECP